MYKKKKCGICGKIFEPHSPHKKYCNEKCIKQARYKSNRKWNAKIMQELEEYRKLTEKAKK